MKKNVNIYLRDGIYYANFRVKRKDPMRGVRTVQVNRSTGSPDAATAQRIANGFRNAELEGLFSVVPKLRDECTTVGALIERFLKRAKIRSASDVADDFLIVVAEGAGLTDPARREEAKKIRLSQLTSASMLAFRDGDHQTRSAGGINKLMRSARSMFSRRALEYYDGLKLPDVSKWMAVSPLPETKNKRFRRIPDSTLAAMDGSAGIILRLARRHGKDTHRGQRWRNAWACYWLTRRCGLRNSEVEELRWEWIVTDSDGRMWIELITRPYWEPKGTSGKVPLAPDLHAAIMAEFGPAGEPTAHVLKGTRSARWDGCHREVNLFVRRHLPDRDKGLYELRKQYGSEIAREYGLETCATILRHSGTQTAWAHYFDDLKLSQVKAR